MNKKIAIISLNEFPYKHRTSWKGIYFQGSCGGWSTQITLTKTFLQEDYAKDWIDGIEFYYEGSLFNEEWDHIDLSGVIYRKILK